ncbi:MAG: winged helix-turn-helix domain-containing protein [Candidatus Methanofastidiosia archaeon]
MISEEYTAHSRKLVYDGCWKFDKFLLPVPRGECEKFAESKERTDIRFWEKWNWKVYVDGDLVEHIHPEAVENESESEQGHSGQLHNEVCNTVEQRQSELASKQVGSNERDESNEATTPGLESSTSAQQDNPSQGNNQSSGKSTKPTHPQKSSLHTPHAAGHHREKTTEHTAGFVKASDLAKHTTDTQSCSNTPAATQKSNTQNQNQSNPQKSKNPTTRSLILQALSNNVTTLKAIAHYAAVDPSTAHYHLRNLIQQGRAVKLSWGKYTFPESPALQKTGKFFKKFLKKSSQSQGGKQGSLNLHPVEKNILVDILSKDNKYFQLSERELAKRNNISRYKVKKYTQKLETKRLITIKRKGKQLIFTPTQVAIEAFSAFFNLEKTGSKIDSSSSKVQPINSKNWSKTGEGEGGITEGTGPGVSNDAGHDRVQEGTTKDEGTGPGDYKDSEYLPQGTPDLGLQDPEHTDHQYPEVGHLNPEPDPKALHTFENYIAWQQKNAHRLIIQFKLLRCNHHRLKSTGWIFGKKSIHHHFTEAFIFKSKDPSKDVINVLPKNPFMFVSPFEFEDQIIGFVNEVIDRLHKYGMVIDLSQPAEIKMEHVALEDDIFARKVVKKGLLYFVSTIHTRDSKGELMKYVIKIDKSKKLHIEFEGREAHYMAETYEAFIDDVVSGKIDRNDLKELPQRVDGINTEIKEEFEKIENRLSLNIEKISDTQSVLHDNQVEFSQNLVSHTRMVKTIGDAAESVNTAADSIKEVTESLKECLHVFREGIELFENRKDFGNNK